MKIEFLKNYVSKKAFFHVFDTQETKRKEIEQANKTDKEKKHESVSIFFFAVLSRLWTEVKQDVQKEKD